jgi:Leucyl-tRNA synthetase
MAPFTPHICEEIWEEIGGEGFVSETSWPEPEDDLRDRDAEAAINYLNGVSEDIREVEGLVDDYETVKIVVASQQKQEFFTELKDVIDDRPEFGEAISRLRESTDMEPDEIQKYLKKYLNDPGDLPEDVFSAEKERDILESDEKYLERKFDAWVDIESETESDLEKASRAEPGKPAIVMQ